MKKHTREFELVNEILIEWNPIGVPESVISEEYSSYIPEILAKINDKEGLITYLEDLLINKMGLDYSPQNMHDRQDLQNIVEKLKQV